MLKKFNSTFFWLRLVGTDYKMSFKSCECELSFVSINFARNNNFIFTWENIKLKKNSKRGVFVRNVTKLTHVRTCPNIMNNFVIHHNFMFTLKNTQNRKKTLNWGVFITHVTSVTHVRTCLNNVNNFVIHHNFIFTLKNTHNRKKTLNWGVFVTHVTSVTHVRT